MTTNDSWHKYPNPNDKPQDNEFYLVRLAGPGNSINEKYFITIAKSLFTGTKHEWKQDGTPSMNTLNNVIAWHEIPRDFQEENS